MLKYVILETASGERLPIFGLAPLSHRDLAAAVGFVAPDAPKAVSAGFVTFTPGNGLVVHPGRSESLRLGPAEGDQAYLNAAYTASLRANEVAATIPY